MINDIIKFIKSLIHQEEIKLKESGYYDLDKKKLMAENAWSRLPDKIFTPLQIKDKLQQVLNFIEFIPDSINNKNSTNHQKLEQIAHEFINDYLKWLEDNQEKFPIQPLIEHYKEKFKDLPKSVSRESFFLFFTNNMIRYFIVESMENLKSSSTPTPPTQPNEPPQPPKAT